MSLPNSYSLIFRAFSATTTTKVAYPIVFDEALSYGHWSSQYAAVRAWGSYSIDYAYRHSYMMLLYIRAMTAGHYELLHFPDSPVTILYLHLLAL